MGTTPGSERTWRLATSDVAEVRELRTRGQAHRSGPGWDRSTTARDTTPGRGRGLCRTLRLPQVCSVWMLWLSSAYLDLVLLTLDQREAAPLEADERGRHLTLGDRRLGLAGPAGGGSGLEISVSPLAHLVLVTDFSVYLNVVVPVLFQVMVPVDFARTALIVPLPPVLAVSLQPEMVPVPLVLRAPVLQVTVGALAPAVPETRAIEPSEPAATIAAMATTRVGRWRRILIRSPLGWSCS